MGPKNPKRDKDGKFLKKGKTTKRATKEATPTVPDDGRRQTRQSTKRCAHQDEGVNPRAQKDAGANQREGTKKKRKRQPNDDPTEERDDREQNHGTEQSPNAGEKDKDETPDTGEFDDITSSERELSSDDNDASVRAKTKKTSRNEQGYRSDEQNDSKELRLAWKKFKSSFNHFQNQLEILSYARCRRVGLNGSQDSPVYDLEPIHCGGVSLEKRGTLDFAATLSVLIPVQYDLVSQTIKT